MPIDAVGPATDPAAAPPRSEVDSGARYARYVLAVLTLIGLVNWMDRSIIAILLDPMKRDLGASDTAMGLLNGLGFSLLYAIAAMPIARLADRTSRRNVLAVGLTLWSAMTALCGLAQSFGQLLVARMGVGAGEAAGAAPSQSMIADYFPSERRAFALGVHTSSMYLGTTLSALVGGYLGYRFGWRVAMVAVSVPGLLLALLLVATVREPLRGRHDRPSAAADTSFGAAIRLLGADPAYRWTVLALCAYAIVNGASLAWTPAFLGRVHHLNLKEVGFALAAVKGVTGVAGVLLGGYVASRFARGGVRFQLGLSAAASALSIPFFCLYTLAPSFSVSLAGVAIFQILVTMPLGVSFAAIQELSPPTMRAVAAATATLFTTLIGIGGGPLYVGALNDALAPTYGPEAVRYGLTLLVPFMIAGSLAYWCGARSAASR